jgi:hypothetical protein
VLLRLNFGGFLASGIYRSLAFAVPPVVIGSMMSIRALTFPKGFVRASVMASIGMALVRTLLGSEGRGLLLCRPLRSDSYSRIVVLSQDGFVLLGSGAWWRLLSFPVSILMHLPRPGLQPGGALLRWPRCVDFWATVRMAQLELFLCHWVAVLDNHVPDDVHLQRSWP